MIEILQGKVAWKPATVKTLLRRLVQKGALKLRGLGGRLSMSRALKNSQR